MDQWRRHVEGMLEGDSVEKDLAMELGVPAHSMSLRERPSGSVAQRVPIPDSPLAESSSKPGEDLVLHSSRSQATVTSPKIPLAPALSTRVSSLTDADSMASPSQQTISGPTMATPPPRPSRHLRYTTQNTDKGSVETDATPVRDAATKRLSDGETSTLHGRATPVPVRPKETGVGDQSEKTPVTENRNPYAFPPESEVMVDETLDSEAEKIALASYQGDETFVKKDRLAEYIGGT